MMDDPDDDAAADAAHLLERCRAIRFDDIEEELTERRRRRAARTNVFAQIVGGALPSLSDSASRVSTGTPSLELVADSLKAWPGPDGAVTVRFAGPTGTIDVQVPRLLIPGLINSLHELLLRQI